LTYLRRFRRSVVVVATALLLLQVMLAGLSVAYAAALAANPFASVICHSAGDGDPADGNAPDTGKVPTDCCVFCTTTGAGLVPAPGPFTMRPDFGREPATPALAGAAISIDPRAVRAGSSQAPPAEHDVDLPA
jgi:hypothetical protein